MINHYDINNDIKFLAKSEIRLKIISELQKKPKSVKELVNTTKITYSSISSNLSKLEEHNYINKKKNKYYLNPLSEIYYRNLMDFKMSIDLINDFHDFWDKHDIDQLSTESLQNIIDLKDSELIKTTPLDIYKTHNTIKEKINESNNLKAIFPYLHPEYPQLIGNILKNNGTIELIIPRNMFKKMIFGIDETIRKAATKEGRLKVHTTPKELKIYLTICDETMSLGLFKSDGSFDQNRILISSSKKSQKWANNLFTNIKGNM
ncbi:MAG: transcriptional regulator FilR1 domain-containing protein [Methanobrevibacter sp.]|nr:transcriptional regulator FilR1 domain-containing protein [Methanobrevibacter sp.]